MKMGMQAAISFRKPQLLSIRTKFPLEEKLEASKSTFTFLAWVQAKKIFFLLDLLYLKW